MRLHFHDLAEVQRRLLDGQLKEARELAFLLTMSDSDPSTEPWRQYTEAVADGARQVMQAKNINEGIRREVKIALACASCHVAIERETRHDVPPVMPSGSSIDDTMARHTWAAARLWEGVITPSEQRWEMGLEALVRAPIRYSAGADEPALAQSLQTRALTELQHRGDTTLEQRVTAYGEILVTCAACHETDRATPLQSRR